MLLQILYLEINGKPQRQTEFSTYAIRSVSTEPMIYWGHMVNINVCDRVHCRYHKADY